MIDRWLSGCLAVFALTGCASLSQPTDVSTPAITLPLIPAWYEDRKLYYISTDAWPRRAALDKGVNYAPRLRDSLPPRPKPPDLKTVLERIYTFPNGEQASVVPSAPEPIGADSTNRPYSPLWLLYEVTWKEPAQRRELTSESALFDAERQGWITITATEMVVNCPIVADAEGNRLPGTTLHW